MATGVIDELLVGLGYDYNDKELKRYRRDIESLSNIVARFARVIATGSAALLGFTSATTAAADEQGKLAIETGVSVENIDALQFALRRAGGQSQGMTNSLRNIAIRAGEAARGVGEGIEAFGVLGISVTDATGRLKNADNLLIEVSRQLQGLTEVEQIALAEKLGLRDSLRLLQQGPAAIRELTNEAMALGVTTAEDAAISAEFQDSLADIWQIIKQISREISRSLAPALTDMNHRVTAWWKTNREIISQKLPEFIDNVTFALRLLAVAAGAYIGLKLGAVLVSLVGLFAKLKKGALAANAAIMLIPAAFAALFLLVEDSKGFFEGQESFIGDMIEKYPKWAGILTNIAAIFATIGDLTQMVFDGWNAIFDLLGKIPELSFGDVGEITSNLFGFLGDRAGALFDLVTRSDDETGTTITTPVSNDNRSSATNIGRIDIQVSEASNAEETAQEVVRQLQQVSQDVNSSVYQ